MERNVLWSPWHEPGLEHLRLVQQSDAIVADGIILAVAQSVPFRARCILHCDIAWRVRKVNIELLDDRAIQKSFC